ncbi:MAG: outer membrane protein assembly factor BamE [Desulfobacteraceae bacterium]|nr:outer membrane protein assembly factor BamE [Desulfobacteraceae bacterium]
MLKTVAILLFSACFAVSCASKEKRMEKFRAEHPDWSQTLLEKVALRDVDIGMSPDMVLAAIGKPYKTALKGDEEEWAYAVIIERGMGGRYPEFVYFVWFGNGKVVRIKGDKSRLGLIPVR